MKPGDIIRGRFARKLFQGGVIFFNESDAVAQHYLKWRQGTILAPLVDHFLGLVKTAPDKKRLGSIGVGRRGTYRGMVNRPIELLESLRRSAELGVSDPCHVVGADVAAMRLRLQNIRSHSCLQMP